jgi:hypothetical protein
MSKRATGIVVAMAAVLMVATSGSQAIATQGEPVIAGELNSETDATWFFNTTAIPGCGTAGFYAVVACGGVHAESDGTDVAVSAEQTSAGGLAIRGVAASGGTGVKGFHTGSTGIGVWGQTPGTGSAVYGEATGPGVGVYGDTTNGTGVIAKSTNGTALSVNGKAKFSRSGKVVIAAGTTSRTVTLAGVTTASMVLATSQQNATVFVRSVVPGSGSFTIRLSGAAPSAGLKVAYFVLN